jgi:predicted phosphodiesterase
VKFIATGDWHLRSDIPRSVKVDSVEKWINLQMQNIDQIFAAAKEIGIKEVVIAGDLFNTHRENQTLLNAAIKTFKSWNEIKVWAIAGNHDLPYHSFENIDDSSFGILKNAECFHLMDKKALVFEDCFDAENLVLGCSFGEEKKIAEDKWNLGVIHRLVAPAHTFSADVKIDDPEMIFAEFPDIKNLIVGDYHHAFIAKKGTGKSQRKLLVPGCIGRQAIDMEDYVCKIWACDLTEKEFKAEPIDLKPLWELERANIAAAKSSLLDAFVSLSSNSFDYKDRILAAENLKPLTASQQALVHEITNGRISQ